MWPKLDDKTWTAIVSLIPDYMRPFIGYLFAMVLVVLLINLFALAPTIIGALVKKPHDECWELKQVGDQLVKFNKCTGDMKAAELLPQATK